jgi:hypothetical protein
MYMNVCMYVCMYECMIVCMCAVCKPPEAEVPEARELALTLPGTPIPNISRGPFGEPGNLGMGTWDRLSAHEPVFTLIAKQPPHKKTAVPRFPIFWYPFFGEPGNCEQDTSVRKNVNVISSILAFFSLAQTRCSYGL